MAIILSTLITLVMGLFAFITYVLVQHKEEIWKTIVFEEDKEEDL